MRVLHCTDIHYNVQAMRWILTNSSLYDLVCLTGDFLDNRTSCSTSLHDQVAALRDWFEQIQSTLFVCSGNHDFYNHSLAWLQSENKHWFADGDKVLVGDVRVGSMGYRDDNFEKVSDCDVLLTHVPPACTSVAKEHGTDFGCPRLRTALRVASLAPGYLLCGHVHSPHKNVIRLKTTIVSNPGGKHGDHQPSYCTLELN